MVVVLGVDVHKDTHTVVGADQAARKVGERVVRATDAGHRQLLGWARRQFPDERVWAVEDCRHVSARLERALLAAGERVVRVPPKLMAGVRGSARTRGKSDPIDALAIARAALREPDLPVAEHDDVSRDLRLLVDHREDLVGERTRIQNRLRWHLHELDPELDIPARGLDRLVVLDRLTDWLTEQPTTVVTRLAGELLADIRALTARINALEAEITTRVRRIAPALLALPGAGALTAAKIVGETANVTRFRSEACFAMHAGAAPIPASSGRINRHRLARGGNRQLNAALHRIAVTQIRLDGLGRAYYQQRRENGDTTMEALRALKRRLARIVFNLLKDQQPVTPDVLPAAA
ncbi:IS110 family transposase [Micromonospora krabiensis]|uniref:Transposase n=1 Tax=Micromonospora krabiensis TaxID=307121 RepID=A0A1C3MX17_9ACTN|nr:IS110 family transposase [Micromonospora krabiensis]SBV24880.1 Transposase [Micromonospora krabiensis]SBV26103.1 Transposase [Micromonospora krabiensis]